MRAVTNDKTNELRWSRKGGLLMMDIARGLAFLHANKVCRLPPVVQPRNHTTFFPTVLAILF